jgi:hypothetical protein
MKRSIAHTLRYLAMSVALCAALPAIAEEISSEKFYRIDNVGYENYCVAATADGLIRETISDDNITKQAFKFVSAGTDNVYYLYNPGMQSYVAPCYTSSKIQLCYNQQEAQKYVVTEYDGYITIGNVTSITTTDDETTISVPGYRYLHDAGWGSIVGWEAGSDVNPSHWTLSVIDTETVDATITLKESADGATIATYTETLPVGTYTPFFSDDSQTLSADNSAMTFTLKSGEGIRMMNMNGRSVYDFISINNEHTALIQNRSADLASSDLTLFQRININGSKVALYNPISQKFVGPITAATSGVSLTSNPKEAGTFEFQYDSSRFAYRFRNATADDSSYAYANAYGGYEKGTNIGGWSGADDDGSHWFVMLTESTTADNFIANADSFTDFKNAYTNASTLSNSLSSGMVNNSADVMNCNYPAYYEGAWYDGGGYAALIDNNVGSFFHSGWDTDKGAVVDGVYHDLEVLMTDNTATNFYVDYARRNSENEYRNPTIIWVYGATAATSFDDADWETEPFAKLTTDDGLGQETGSFAFTTGDKKYKALKFEMREVKNKDNYTSTYFNYGTFKLYSTEYDPEEVIAMLDYIADAATIDLGITSNATMVSMTEQLNKEGLIISLPTNFFTDNTALYTLHNCDTAADRGYAISTGTGYFEQLLGSEIDTTVDRNLWGLVSVGDKYYLYNYGDKLFANAYGEQSDANTNNHNYSWQLSKVATPVEIKSCGYALPAVAIIGGENNIANRYPGMMTFNSGSHRIVVVNGCGSDADGNGWIFTKVEKTATDAEITALFEGKEKADAEVEKQLTELTEAATAEGNDNVLGNITTDALNDLANMTDATADTKQHAIESAERVQPAADKVYTIKSATADTYYGVDESNQVVLAAKDEQNPNRINWILSAGSTDGTYKFIHYISGIESSSSSSQAPAIRRTSSENVATLLTIDDNSEFALTFPEVGKTSFNSSSDLFVVTKVSDSQDDATTLTKIEEITAEAAADAPVYDLQGRRAARVLPGRLYISDGKIVRAKCN